MKYYIHNIKFVPLYIPGDINYRWPELKIETINSVPLEPRNDNEAGNRNYTIKKRKLFHEDSDAIIDIP